jgi:fumarate reductase flavoprotein subunit
MAAIKNSEAGKRERPESGFSRRDFLAGAAVASMASTEGGPGQGLSAADKQAKPASNKAPTSEETLSADVVVCGTGSAGMAAAVRAGELGAKVIVLEKVAESLVGGSSALTAGLFAVESTMTKKKGITNTADALFLKQIDYHRYACNARVLRKYLDRSGATVDWLLSQGVDLLLPDPPYNPNTHFYADAKGGISEGSAGRGLKVLYARGKKYGVKFMFQAPATELAMKNGKVTGVVATKPNGNWVKVAAPVVIIATGGYASKEMFDRFTVYNFENLAPYGIPGRTGDGIKMGLSAGAALHHPGAVNFCNPKIPGEKDESLVNVTCAKQQPFVWVNESGVRFANEATILDWTLNGQAIALQQKVFSIADTAIFDHMKTKGVWHRQPMTNMEPGTPLPNLYVEIDRKLAEPNPVAFKADSLENLASLMGVDPKALKDTVDTYNSYAAGGKDLDFGKPAEWLLPFQQPPFYAFSMKLAFYNTIGGLKVDDAARVLAKAGGKAIPGLYACGSDAGGIFGYYYDISIAPGVMQGWCTTSGLLAAEDAVLKYLKM